MGGCGLTKGKSTRTFNAEKLLVNMDPCWVCGKLFEDLDLEPSPNWSGNMVCAECCQDIQDDLDRLYEEENQ